MPRMGLHIGDKSPRDSSSSEPLLWTVNDGTPLKVEYHDSKMQSDIGSSAGVLESTLEYTIGTGMKVTYPDEAEFVSATPEAHRKGEKAYHVKAFRGSKDGELGKSRRLKFADP